MSDNNARTLPFGIELLHSAIDVRQYPPDQSARSWLKTAEINANDEGVVRTLEASEEIEMVVGIRRASDEDEGLMDIFTVPQIIELQERIHTYLGCNLKDHVNNLSVPMGYPYYIGRLSMHFMSTDDDVTSGFGAFAARHSFRDDNDRGPWEANSRNYAIFANQAMIRSIEDFYGSGMVIELRGPTKTVEGSRISWERGIAECQFLILDYLVDQLAMGRSNSLNETVVMSIADLESNVGMLISEKSRLLSEVSRVNPFIATTLEKHFDRLLEQTLQVFHRGRMGVSGIQKNPTITRATIKSIEQLLEEAGKLTVLREDQAEIPILDL